MTSQYSGDIYQESAEFYDPVYDARQVRDVEFFVDYSRQAKSRTLELGCGTGRVLIPTAVSGFDITGLDLSTFMLRKCREKLAYRPQEVQQRVRLVQGNMTDFNTGENYSLVTIPFRPFQHLITVEEQKACLHGIHRHLVAGGLLVFDVFHPRPDRLYDPQYQAEQEEFHDLKLANGQILRRTSRVAAFHRDQQYNDIELIYYVSHPDGRTERLVQAFPMRYFFRYELVHLLELCGFRVNDIFGNFHKSPFSSDSPEMILVAEKK